ncbi:MULTISPECIES: DNA-binding protein transcriptional regulator [unclassified Haloferax]|uniref:DNA-binding protein transcriptional regulator n=1 Tax=Haloferax TaxID=2251 RepID=UPI0002B1A640|nr:MULTISPECIES: DNA-binding protein transcriptional regulator [unclassified Haloferax]ELZ60320.1 DNA binding protein transcriptional regulator [Haloferax sp. ATCC BAA-646]ELZ64533.1 DNA binding protein transcriptional regulator [Haloferax sp. ATCC BAA-645]ELZ69633.1 DNA binding protein transcriptional regulator [Haloferax sp. ATCC BAA-644]
MWFQSGRRRDLCAVLYDAGELRGQKLKTRLERYYDLRIDPQAFYGTLDALVEAGHLERRTEGIHDVYGLTDAGAERVESYHAWLAARVENGARGAEDAEDTNESVVD